MIFLPRKSLFGIIYLNLNFVIFNWNAKFKWKLFKLTFWMMWLKRHNIYFYLELATFSSLSICVTGILMSSDPHEGWCCCCCCYSTLCWYIFRFLFQSWHIFCSTFQKRVPRKKKAFYYVWPLFKKQSLKWQQFFFGS